MSNFGIADLNAMGSFLHQPKTSDNISVEDFIKKYNGRLAWEKLMKKDTNFHLMIKDVEFFNAIYTVDTSFMRANPLGYNEKVALMRGAYETFMAVEETITNRELFWLLFGSMNCYCDFSSMFLDHTREAVNRYDRRELHWNKRIKYTNYFEDKEQRDKFKRVMDKYNQEDEITVYRGFVCRVGEGKRIRKGRKSDGDSFYEQQEGLGISYSLKENVARDFSLRFLDIWVLIDDFMENIKVLGEDAKVAREHVSQMRVADFFKWFKTLNEEIQFTFMKRLQERIEMRVTALQKHEIDESFGGFDTRPVVGEYRVKKKDVLTVHNMSGKEWEIVALPEATKLIRYEFTPSNYFFKQSDTFTKENF